MVYICQGIMIVQRLVNKRDYFQSLITPATALENCLCPRVFFFFYDLVMLESLCSFHCLPSIFITTPLMQQRSIRLIRYYHQVTHRSKSMPSNFLLWSIISNLKSSSHYLRSFMYVACGENLNLNGLKCKLYLKRSGSQTFFFVFVNVDQIGIKAKQLLNQSKTVSFICSRI